MINQQIKAGILRAILLLLILQIVFFAVPVPAQRANQTRAVQYGVGVWLVVTGDGSLVGWGWADDGLLPKFAQDIVPIPFFLRQTILRDVTQIAAGYEAAAAVDEKNRLWIWGDLAPMPEECQRVRGQPMLAMEGVTAVALGNRRTAVILEDGSLWGWGYAAEWDGIYHAPYQIAEDAETLTFRGSRLFYTDQTGTLYEEHGDPNTQPQAVLNGIEAIQYTRGFPWDYLVLTKEGDVFGAEEALDSMGSTKIQIFPSPLMRNVACLADQGWITDDGVYWKVSATGELEKGPDKIAAFAKDDFYVTEDGYLHCGAWPPVSLLAVSTGLRNFFFIFLVAWIFCFLKSKRKQRRKLID